MDNKNHIDRIFKGGLENYELRPSPDMWDQISAELSNNSKTPAAVPYAKYAALIFLFFSICTLTVPAFKDIPFDQITNFNTPGNSSLAAATELIKAANTAVAIEDAGNVVSVDATNYKKEANPEIISLTPIASVTIKSEGDQMAYILAPNEPESDEVAERQQDIIDRIYNEDVAINLLSYSSIGYNRDEHRVESREIDRDYMDLDMRGLYIGVSGAYNQTSIVEYGSSFKGERPIQPSLKFGSAKGFVLGYNFSNKFGVQAEYIYKALLGQNYIISEGDEIIQKSMSLNYDLFPVTAKIKVGKISDITDRPVVLNYIAGVEYGMLRSARLPQDKRYESTDNVFKKDEISILLGLDYDIYIQDNVFISVGARGSFSNDISLHSAPFNDYAKHNFIFGLRASLNYSFRD